MRLSKIEIDRLQNFLEKHTKYEGNKYLLVTTPPEIKTSVEIICLDDGVKQNITDYGFW